MKTFECECGCESSALSYRIEFFKIPGYGVVACIKSHKGFLLARIAKANIQKELQEQLRTFLVTNGSRGWWHRLRTSAQLYRLSLHCHNNLALARQSMIMFLLPRRFANWLAFWLDFR